MADTTTSLPTTTTTEAAVATAVTTTTVVTTSSAVARPATGDVNGFKTVEVEIDGGSLPVALADNPGRRTRGLRGVEDLGDLAGMLFVWGEEVTSRFTMADTLIALDIAFLDVDGVVLEVLEMEPCATARCPNYGIDQAYWYALESPLGSLGLEPGDEVILP